MVIMGMMAKLLKVMRVVIAAMMSVSAMMPTIMRTAKLLELVVVARLVGSLAAVMLVRESFAIKGPRSLMG